MPNIYDETLSDTLDIKETFKIKGRHNGSGKPFFDQFDGDDLCRATGVWMKKSMLVDRDNNWYSETVTNPETGEVVHECEERLSDHRGHGSDKSKSKGEG